MDCYAGSGTTLAAASDLARRWIGVDRSDEAIKTILRRLRHGTERMGDFVNGTPKARTLSLFTVDDFTLYVEVGQKASSALPEASHRKSR
jgi:adenine-specific DNA-methyltransferase